METFIQTIKDMLYAIMIPFVYPDYIENEKRLGEFENSLSNLERGVTINRIDSGERLHKTGGEDLPTTLSELLFGWFLYKND